MRKTLLTGIAALFLWQPGTAHAQTDALDKMFVEDARKARALARCNMELMKYDAMKPEEVPDARGQLPPVYSLQKRFFTHCMGAEGYAFDAGHRMPKPFDANETCFDRWNKKFDLDFPDCWKRDPR
jgi:hypothetical protein